MIYASTFSSFSQLAVCLLTCLITMFWLFFCWMNVPIGILHTPRVQQNVIIIIFIRWQNDDQYKTRRQVLGRLPNGNTIRLMWFSINHQPHNATDNENINTKTIKNILIFCDLISTCILCIRVAMSINCICWPLISVIYAVAGQLNEWKKILFKIIQLKWAFK